MNKFKFSFILKSDSGSGRITERVLAETDSRDRASILRHRFRTIAGGFGEMRICKKVKVIDVNMQRLRVFDPEIRAPHSGQIFNSIDALANAIRANPVTLRAALSRGRHLSKGVKAGVLPKATVRGVTYAYAA